jgi:hypothetical protein
MNIQKTKDKIFEAQKEKMFSNENYIVIAGILKNNKFSVIKVKENINNLDRIYNVFTNRFKIIEF